MKKRITILLSTVLAIASIEAMAQDRIHTIKGETIEAIIVEIGDESIVYKDFADQDGPVYRLGVNKIISIQMSNGKQKIFNNLPRNFTLPSELDTHRGIYIYGDGVEMPNSSLQIVLGQEEYNKLSAGIRQKKTGRILTWVGAGMSILGAAAGIATLYNYSTSSRNNLSEDERTIITSSVVLLGVGAPMLIASIPIKVSARHKINDVLDNYNARQHACIGLGVTYNGVGLALNF